MSLRTQTPHRIDGDEIKFVAGGDVPATSEILVLNRDPEMRTFLNRALYAGNFSTTTVSSPQEARALLRRGGITLLLIGVEDSITPELDEFFGEVKRDYPGLAMVAIAPRPEADLVRQVLLQGVHDFILDPLEPQLLIKSIREHLKPVSREMPALPGSSSGKKESQPSSSPVSGGGGTGSRRSTNLPTIIAKNPRMKRVLEIGEQIAATDSTVLIQGESGTGKEIIAKYIHTKSLRSDQVFVEVNCGALPENLLESQLFGHEKGSFTGAFHRQVGLFEVSDRGTIFLDEIGEMGLDVQVKLLRVLQNHEFRRIGGSQTLKVNVRVIAATNRDLKAEVENKRFRADLFYRLNVIALEIPPLRERLEEVPELIESFCTRLQSEKGIARKSFTPEALIRMQKCRWLGNVRELENAVERLVLLSAGQEITAGDVDEHLADDAPLESPFAPTLTLDEVKRIHIARVMKENSGNKMRTARLLGINVKTLYNLIKSLNIPVE